MYRVKQNGASESLLRIVIRLVLDFDYKIAETPIGVDFRILRMAIDTVHCVTQPAANGTLTAAVERIQGAIRPRDSRSVKAHATPP
jgi:hypothetical protein